MNVFKISEIKNYFLVSSLIFGLLFAIQSEQSFASGSGSKELTNLLSLKTFVVNLQVANRFLKVDMQLEFEDAHKIEKVNKEIPRLRDAIIRILTNKTANELLTVEGKDILREDIIKVSNITLGGEEVIDVYFTDFVIQ
ncbi:MAG: flagellar basal body-associated FliL family protein [Deltaproteobacteria bacterium]|jgi:flagellar FliL protein|nr:flagellar basal body-associated FliL family protein [Deltaproteobacteria bacterium]